MKRELHECSLRSIVPKIHSIIHFVFIDSFHQSNIKWLCVRFFFLSIVNRIANDNFECDGRISRLEWKENATFQKVFSAKLSYLYRVSRDCKKKSETCCSCCFYMYCLLYFCDTLFVLSNKNVLSVMIYQNRELRKTSEQIISSISFFSTLWIIKANI